MTPHRCVIAAAFVAALVVGTVPASAQGSKEPGTLAIAFPSDPASPIPTIWSNNISNREVSDLIFLRLADLGPELNTAGDKGFVPRLARKWERRDAVTLVFELDPRARWHDGKPVTPADVLLGFERARNPLLSPSLSTLLKRVRSVTAEGTNLVVVKFTERYSEQMYDATFQAPPLPAHLLSAMVPESLKTSSFVSQPIGNGPYRWVRRVPGQLVELGADSTFFLGRPKITRVLFLVAGSPEARANLILSGTADAVDNIYSLPNPTQLEKLPTYQYYPVPAVDMIYIGMNQRDPADSSRPHPILSDPIVRKALTLALDRQAIARAQYGAFSSAPGGPVSALLARSLDQPPLPPYDTAQAVKLLVSRGWIDHDGDGIRDKDGKPLSLGLNIPAVSNSRKVMGGRIQEFYRILGIDIKLVLIDRPVWQERHDGGNFDLDFAGAGQDPTPSGLSQAWSCAGIGGLNVLHYCDPKVDSLMAKAIVAEKGVSAAWGAVVRQIADDYPAIFIAAPVTTYAVSRRFKNVSLRPGSAWSDVWRWSPAGN